MADIFIDVTNNDCMEFVRKLDKLHRSALPIAIRETLNDLAFTQKKFIPKISKKEFITRSRTFFTAFTSVDKAQGFDIKSMKSVVGFTTKGVEALKNMRQQEEGGTIRGKSYTYDKNARGGRERGLVQEQFRIKKLGMVRGETKTTLGRKGTKKKWKPQSHKAVFIASAIMAKKTGKFMISGNGDDKVAILVDSIYLAANGRVSLRTFKVATFKKGGQQYSVKRKHPFMLNSMNESKSLIRQIWANNAEKRITKALYK